jgi:CHAT domain-containing protein
MSVEPVNVAELQGLLPEGTTLVEYLVGRQHALAWVVDRTSLTVVRLPMQREQIVSGVRAFRRGIEGQIALAEAQTQGVLVRQDATETRTKSLIEAAGLLHFATHGELNERDPLASGLLLTPGAPDDGRLEVREIFGLDLKAQLVVLSACETGLGQLGTGDELVGLQRAFLYAGSPAVITTLWKVDDRASFGLMREFYDQLARLDAAQALQAAQRAALKAFPHPFAWAGFGLTGVGR